VTSSRPIGRVTIFGWLLLGAAALTVALAIVAPGAALVAAVILAVLALTALAEGFTSARGHFDVDTAAERKRDFIARRLKRGRPHWERTPPDHADEPTDAIWARERERRGLR
jgi:hypothetical protein